jgi:hypothetical protein
MEAWLAETLEPFDLTADFLAKISGSAQDALIHAIRPHREPISLGHLHILIFVPPGYLQKDGQTWGFFRIGKPENTQAEENAPEHTIAFYLYLEG